MNNRTVAKVCFGIAALAGAAMAVYGWQHSFSQNALEEFDGVLRVYLGFGALGYGVLTANAIIRNDLVRILWLFKIQWGYVFLWLAIAFIAVSATNVTQLETPHVISTASIFIGAAVLPLYLEKYWKGSAYIALGLAVFYFWRTYQHGLHTIAWGELAVTAVALAVTWIIINEQIQK